MLKKLHILLLTLLAAVCFTVTAWADYDYIEQYGVMVTPNTEDGSLLITVKLEWTPLEGRARITSPGAMVFLSRILALSTTPTEKPARSYSSSG